MYNPYTTDQIMFALELLRQIDITAKSFHNDYKDAVSYTKKCWENRLTQSAIR